MKELKTEVKFIEKETDLRAFCKVLAERIASGDVILESKVNDMIETLERITE